MATSNSLESESATSRPKRRLLWLALLIPIGAILGISKCTRVNPGAGALKGFATPAWENQNGEKLLVRPEDHGSDALLLRCLNWEESLNHRYKNSPPTSELPPMTVVYRYDPQKHSLEKVGIKEWEAAEGVVSDEVSVPRESKGVVGHDVTARVALCNGNPMATAGKTALRTECSPDGHLVAILSTTGTYSQPGMLFGGGGASGQRSHEVFRRADCSRVGKAVPLDYYERSDGLTATWSADSKYVIYSDGSFSKVFIIPVESGGDKE